MSDFSNLTFAEGTVPETSRSKTPNPFADKFPVAEGKALILEMPNSTADEQKNVQKVVSLAQAAGREKGTTTRVRRDPSADGKRVTLTFWSVAKITRDRAK